MYASLNSDPSDPDVIIKLDISIVFNVLCRRLTLDVLGGKAGKASCDCACGLKEGDNIETVCEELRNMFEYFKSLNNKNNTKILFKGISAAETHAAAHRLLAADPSLAHIGPLLSSKAFVVDCYIGLGVPIGTDEFVQHFVKAKCQEIMEDVNKLDNLQDCFIHYQLFLFCQATRLQYLNCQVQLTNLQVLQQQHVNHKIANALLKKGTREAYKTLTQQDSAWVDMRQHESHDQGGFDIPNTITLSQGTPLRTRQTLGLLPSWALLLALPRRFGCQATTSMIPPPGAPPPSVRSGTCTQHFYRTTTAQSSLQRICPHSRQAREAAPRPTQAHHHHH
jgi:hypothetical protein